MIGHGNSQTALRRQNLGGGAPTLVGKAVSATDYPVNDLEAMITAINWNLDKLPLIANGRKVFPDCPF